MQISIDNLSVKRLGPIDSIKWDFQDINLIYGRNEKGKTFIVEYLLSSLFRNPSKTRQLTDSGQVSISGLEESNTRFNPKSRRKIEDYLFPGDKPVDLSRLLVVKAGQTRFTSDLTKGINKNILKDYLSDQRTLDAIMKHIPKNIQNSSWVGGQLILGRNAGECKTYNNYLDQLNRTDRLLSEIDEKFSQGEIAQEKMKLDELEALIHEQEKARSYYAYQKSIRINEINQDLAQLPQESLDEIRYLHTQVNTLEKQIQKAQGDIDILEPQCTHYQWLETAIDECEKRPAALKAKSSGLLFLIPGILFITAAIVFSFFNFSWGSLVSGLLAVVLFILSFLYHRKRLKNIDEIAEIKRIFDAFEEKFGEKARAITDLKARFDELTPKHFTLQNIIDGMEEDRGKLFGLQEELRCKLVSLSDGDPELEKAELIIRDLQNKRDFLEEQREEEKIALAGLGMENDQYSSEPVKTVFNPELMKTYVKQRDETIQSIQEKENTLQTLKQQACDLSRMEISCPWDQAINALRNHRDEVCIEMKESKTKIGSGVVITEVVNEIRTKEDENICRALASPNISEPINVLTHNYRGVEMEGEEIYALSEFERFQLHNLSTGAQEQILLALRIGIASHFLKDKKMFLILDDAFQHSDWQRREWMVDQMADLASIGWQIIYFAMDDHIKQLFEERVKPRFQNRYAKFEL